MNKRTPPETFTHNGVVYNVTRAAPAPGQTLGVAVELARAAGQPSSPFDQKLCRVALRVLCEIDTRQRVRHDQRAAETAKPPTRAEAVAPLMRAWDKAEATKDAPVEVTVTQWRQRPTLPSPSTPSTPVSITESVRGPLRRPGAVQREPGDDGAHDAAHASAAVPEARSAEVPPDNCTACGAALNAIRVCPTCGLKDSR